MNARLVTDRGIAIRRARARFGRVFTAIAVHVIKVFSLRVIGLHLVITDGPRGRDSAVMTNLSKVFLAQAKQSRAVELRVATDEIIGMRMQRLAFTVVPGFLCVVLRV